jgi:hypothetical protein
MKTAHLPVLRSKLQTALLTGDKQANDHVTSEQENVHLKTKQKTVHLSMSVI